MTRDEHHREAKKNLREHEMQTNVSVSRSGGPQQRRVASGGGWTQAVFTVMSPRAHCATPNYGNDTGASGSNDPFGDIGSKYARARGGRGRADFHNDCCGG